MASPADAEGMRQTVGHSLIRILSLLMLLLFCGSLQAEEIEYVFDEDYPATCCCDLCCEDPRLPTMIGRGGLLQSRVYGGSFVNYHANHFSGPSENNSARAQDRIAYQFNYLKNVPFGDSYDPTTMAVGINENRDIEEHRILFEKTFLVEGFSIDLVLPIYQSTSRQQVDYLVTPGPWGIDGQFGDIAFGFKQEIINNSRNTISVGLRVEAPTRDDLASVTDALIMEDKVWHFMPYVAWEKRIGDWYTQAWATYRMNSRPLMDVVLPSSPIPVSEPEYLFIDVAVGKKIFESRDWRSFLSTELHYLNSTTHETIPTGQTLTANYYGRTDVLDLTLGLTTIIHNQFSVAAGLALPLRNSPHDFGTRVFPTDRNFDVAFMLNTNFYY